MPQYVNESSDFLITSPGIENAESKNGELSFGGQSNSSIGKHINNFLCRNSEKF